MLIYEPKATTIEKLKFVICDICKKKYDNDKDFLETQEFFHIQETGGYGSVFGDGKEINVDICQHCMNKILIDNQVEI